MNLTADEIALAHEIDDHKKHRTAALRVIDRATDLLQDMPHALDHGRTEVVMERLERVLSGLAEARPTFTEETTWADHLRDTGYDKGMGLFPRKETP